MPKVVIIHLNARGFYQVTTESNELKL